MTKAFSRLAAVFAVLSLTACGPGDPFAGTTWTSTTVPMSSMASGVASARYSITFHNDGTNCGPGGLCGSFTGSLAITYSAMASSHAGCMEMSTFTGGQWQSTTTGTNPTVTVTGVTATLSRSGCTTATDNQTAMPDSSYTGQINLGTETWVINGTSATATGNSGVWADMNTFMFTRM